MFVTPAGLEAALLAMDADERELVEWFDFDKLSHMEISERLDATPKSVSSRLDTDLGVAARGRGAKIVP